MGLLTYETKIDHHEGGELTLELERKFGNTEATITIGTEAARDRIALTLEELDQVVKIADRFRRSLVAFGDAA